jgi:hypothetical protein
VAVEQSSIPAGSFRFFGSFGKFVDLFEEVDDVDAADGGCVVVEAEDGCGFEDDPFHDLGLDGSVVAVEFGEDGFWVTAEDSDPDFAFLEVVGDFDFADGDEFAVPFVVALDDGADFPAEQFVDLV